MAATVSDDFTCRVWDLDEGDEECLHVLEGHTGWWVDTHAKWEYVCLGYTG